MASVLESAEGKLVLRGVFFDISEQKKSELELDQLNLKLREASREAGMAEIATGVLHNVGNVLNSVNVSASLVVAQIRKSKSSSLSKGVALLQEHRDDLVTFFSQDPRARQLPTFLQAVSEQILKEQALLSTELQSLQQNIDH
ncbi:MAG TPA: hypothetical protein PLN52_17640, partial [Opitutaceae bacterium]|nr:hypothetical protein [Opitutaceae bacterium]